MKVDISARDGFVVVGMKYRGRNENKEIPALWGEFMPRFFGEITGVVDAPVFYGVMGNYDMATGAFDYVAGSEVLPGARAETVTHWDFLRDLRGETRKAVNAMDGTQSVELRPLGRTNIRITPIGLGVMEFAGGGGGAGRMFPVMPQEEKNAIVRAALDGGINWFDTAEMYGRGVSERSLADALQAAGKTGDEVVVATKWFPLLRTARNISHSIADRLRFLAPYPIGLYMIHNPGSFSSIKAEMDAMADLVGAGKIRSVGVSNFSAGRMRRAHKALAARGLPLAANQVRYNLLHRGIETNGVLDAAKELGVTIIAYTPLEAGVLSGKYHRDPALLARRSWLQRRQIQGSIARSGPLVAALEEIAAAHDVTAAQVALNWVVYAQGETVVAIPAATKVAQAAQNAGAMHFRLSDYEMARLSELSSQASRS